MSAHLSEWMLRRLRTGELVGAELAWSRGHVEACEPCQTRLAALETEQKEFEAQVPFERFAEGVERARAAESYFTMGMRGEYDESMQADDPAAVVADVLATQRALIKEAHGREDAVPRKPRPNRPPGCQGHPWAAAQCAELTM